MNQISGAKTIAALIVGLGTLHGCLQYGGSEPIDEGTSDTAKTSSAIINGTPLNPEYTGHVKIWDISPLAPCSGELLTNRSIITASHCIDPADLSSPSRLRVAMGGQFAGASDITLNPSFDVAVIRMDKAFWADPASVLVGQTKQRKGRNVPIQSAMVTVNKPVTCFGYGINAPGSGLGTLRTASMTAEINGASWQVFYHRNGSNQIGASGDSGMSCLSIQGNFPTAFFVVESVQSFCDNDMAPTVCTHVNASTVRSWALPLLSTCSHDLCRPGDPLTTSCDPCAASVCAADGFCCSGGWDDICVSEVASVCGPTCNVSCGHDICTPGNPISTGCDTCAATICASDSFCCNNLWDDQCVGEVTSLCNRSCE